MLRILIAIALAACSLQSLAQDRMLFVEYRVVSPQLPPSSPESQSRKLWLLGNKYMRFEDVPNAQTGVHGMIIVSEPDIWFVDRKTNTGKHNVDPGPTYSVHFPILANEQSSLLNNLEFGRERTFFLDRSARDLGSEKVDGISCTVLGIEVDGRDLKLFLDKDNKPVQISVKTDAYQYAVRYVKFQPGLDPKLDLFKLPPGVKLN